MTRAPWSRSDSGPSRMARGMGATDMTLDLAPNECTVPAGHHLELELVGSTAPWFRKSNGTFKITVTAASTAIGRS